jgi:phospholipid transport system substrate-binding protein
MSSPQAFPKWHHTCGQKIGAQSARLRFRASGFGRIVLRNRDQPDNLKDQNQLHSKLEGRYFRMRILWVIVAILLGAISLAAPLRAEQDPTSVIKALVNPALQIMADKTTPLKDRQQKLRDLVDSNFDFAAMSRSALGRHWKDLNEQRRNDFTLAFTAFLQDSYLSRIQGYSGQQVNFRGQSQIDAVNYEVKTIINQPDGKTPIQVNYTLREDRGRWLIYDVTVDNVSIAANYRNQFNRVINDHGFDTLLADLKHKQQGLQEQLGTPHSHD